MAVSSSSTSTRSSPWTGNEEKRHSPIPYRVGPLDYQPPVLCFCKRKAALWISWSDDNPGRRYLKCYRAREGGCSFHGWYEGQHDAFVRTLLVDLRNAVWSLKRQTADLKQDLVDANSRLEEQEKKMAGMKKEVAEFENICCQKKELKVAVRRLEVEKMVMKAFCAFLAAVVVFMWLLGH